jgi:hypothetical protein
MSKKDWDPKKKESAYINIGGGLRFLTADYFLREMGPLGMTMRGFRGLCKSLGVPMIRMGRTWLIELFAFQQAMRAISRPGQPDFLAPGCDLKASANKPKFHQTTLDPEYFEKNREAILAELLAARRASGLPTPKDTEKAAKAAAKRLVHHQLQQGDEKQKEDMKLFNAPSSH